MIEKKLNMVTVFIMMLIFGLTLFSIPQNTSANDLDFIYPDLKTISKKHFKLKKVADHEKITSIFQVKETLVKSKFSGNIVNRLVSLCSGGMSKKTKKITIEDINKKAKTLFEESTSVNSHERYVYPNFNMRIIDKGLKIGTKKSISEIKNRVRTGRSELKKFYSDKFIADSLTEYMELVDSYSIKAEDIETENNIFTGKVIRTEEDSAKKINLSKNIATIMNTNFAVKDKENKGSLNSALLAKKYFSEVNNYLIKKMNISLPEAIISDALGAYKKPIMYGLFQQIK